MKDINILWFKKDLRIEDNEALYESYPYIYLKLIYGIKKHIQEGNGNFVRKVY
jgi:deoxyribodipyrimidine photolyase